MKSTVKFKMLISLSKTVVFIFLFAFFVSRVITAMTKLEDKDSTVHIHFLNFKLNK